ncbi:MAG: cytochrome c3 family protein [Deltaproteobacteria bacterium]|jgi:hypothetical protein|nr:cytochrome c3 family protein [Deltaproteobacteria bacterium]
MPKIILKCVFCLWFIATVSYAGEPFFAEAPQDSIDIDRTRRPVLFSHQSHGAVQCASCHHTEEAQATRVDVQGKSCASANCHDNMDSRDTSINSYYLAMHKKEKDKYWSCLSCHTEYTEQSATDAGRTKELIGCKDSGCHN